MIYQRFMRIILAALFAGVFIFSPALVTAESGFKMTSDLELQISSLPEAKLRFNQGFVFPFLQGENPLVADNNIKFVLSPAVTPVSIECKGEVILTPVAFFLLSGGALAYSGWNLPIGKGLGINAPEDKNAPADPPRKAKVYGDAFDGLVWRVWGAGTFQFDLGAIIPGDWTHVVFQTRQEFRYGAYTRAGAGEPWFFENDDGENQNGWNYLAAYILGYQMPKSPVISMIGIMAELNKNLYNTPGGDFWGDDLGYWILSGMGVFTITADFNATLAIQMRTRRNNGNMNYNKTDYYYQDYKLLDEGGVRRLVFFRAALILNYKLR